MERKNPSFDRSIAAAFRNSSNRFATVSDMRDRACLLQASDLLSEAGSSICSHRKGGTLEWDHWLATSVSCWHRAGRIRHGERRGQWFVTDKGLVYMQRLEAAENAIRSSKQFPTEDKDATKIISALIKAAIRVMSPAQIEFATNLFLEAATRPSPE